MQCLSEVPKLRKSAQNVKDSLSALTAVKAGTLHAGDAIACAELCGPGCSTNRSQLPPLPFCQHLKGIVKILLHSLTVPGRTLPLLVSRFLLFSQIFDGTGITTSGEKEIRIPGSAMITVTDLSAGINVRADWAPPGLHPSTRQDPCCHMSAYRKKAHYV